MSQFDDRSFLYGDALFETVCVRDGRAEFVAEHIARFERSAEFFGYTDASRAAAVEALGGLVSADDGLWRVTASREADPYPFGGTASLQIQRRDFPNRNPRELATVVGFYLPDDPIAEHKTTSYLRHVEARRRAMATGADDAVMVADDGRVGETSTANLFAVFDDTFVTPEIAGILPGIVRAKVIQALAGRGMKVEERALTLAELRRASEVFVTSSGVGVCAVRQIDSVEYASTWAETLDNWVFTDD